MSDDVLSMLKIRPVCMGRVCLPDDFSVSQASGSIQGLEFVLLLNPQRHWDHPGHIQQSLVGRRYASINVRGNMWSLELNQN